MGAGSFMESYFMTDKQTLPKLKADRPHPRNYPHTPTDYRHTDNQGRRSNGLCLRVVTDVRVDRQMDRQTEGWTDRWTQPSALSPHFVVNKY